MNMSSPAAAKSLGKGPDHFQYGMVTFPKPAVGPPQRPSALSGELLHSLSSVQNLPTLPGGAEHSFSARNSSSKRRRSSRCHGRIWGRPSWTPPAPPPAAHPHRSCQQTYLLYLFSQRQVDWHVPAPPPQSASPLQSLSRNATGDAKEHCFTSPLSPVAPSIATTALRNLSLSQVGLR